MRILPILLLLSAFALAQAPSSTDETKTPAETPAPAKAEAAEAVSPDQIVIPAGTKVPVALKHAISTKGAHEGDAVYAETTFPVVQDGHILIPAGTYVQGRISNVKRAGRVKGRAEVLIHFTTLIYPTGYTVMLPGSVENVPGAENTSMKGEEGTIRADSEKGKDIGRAASAGATGALIGAAAQGGKGALIGGGIGGAVGTAIALLSRGSDVRLEPGTTLEMVIQRPVPLDKARISTAQETTIHMVHQ